MTCPKHTLATSVITHTPLLDMVIRACAAISRKVSEVIFGSVSYTVQKRQRECNRLLADRQVLMQCRAKAAKNHRRVSTYDAAIKDITNQLLRAGL